MDLDILSLNPLDKWTPDKKILWDRLQVLTQRIVEKQVDITSNFGSDFYLVRMTYAIFNDAKEANSLYHKVCALSSEYDYDRCQEQYNDAVAKSKFKSLKRLLKVCEFFGIDTKFEDESVPQEYISQYLPEGANTEFFDEFGFFELGNKYWTLEKSGSGWKPKNFTNFKLRVLYHMNDGKNALRMIELVNERGKMKRVGVPTEKMVSKGKFKELCEGYGNFRFHGSEGQLDMLKAYLYEQERPAYAISELGWNEDGFWVWSNGIFRDKFMPVDNNGYVELNDKHYFIPAGNLDEPGRSKKYSSQIRFRHFVDHHISFTEWSKMYYDVFPENGPTILTFAIACLFSDIIFDKKQFFPLLFVYGEGGSGKGSAIKMAQRLYGVPQDPMSLSSRANTDKARISITAQYVNSLILMEEYTPMGDIDQMLKNFWDRYGYKRRTMDSSYNTETVPIQSGVAVTSNFTPSDDPLLQRVIYLVQNVNQWSPEAKLKFNNLQEYCEKGVTHCTHELLSKRSQIEHEFREEQMKTYKEIRAQYSKLHNCTDRMIENIAVLISVYTILARNTISFPFTRDQLIDELVESTARQNERRDSGGDVQKFFDAFQTAVQTGLLMEDVHYRLDEKYLYFNVKMVHGVYAKVYRDVNSSPSLSLNNLRDKLKIHQSYYGYKDSYRINDVPTSCFQFEYDKIGIDLIAASNVYKGMRRANSPLQQSYEDKKKDKRRGGEGWQPVEDGPPL